MACINLSVGDVTEDHSGRANFSTSDSPNGLRKVKFRSSASLITDFTPYGEVYGAHPSTFCFDAYGHMIRPAVVPQHQCLEELMAVDLGNMLECTSHSKVYYSTKPHVSNQFEDMRAVEEGDQIEVLERRGKWVFDGVGWLPLLLLDKPLFAVFYF